MTNGWEGLTPREVGRLADLCAETTRLNAVAVEAAAKASGLVQAAADELAKARRYTRAALVGLVVAIACGVVQIGASVLLLLHVMRR